jgi:hypothetical protein
MTGTHGHTREAQYMASSRSILTKPSQSQSLSVRLNFAWRPPRHFSLGSLVLIPTLYHKSKFKWRTSDRLETNQH